MPIYGYRCSQCGHELEVFQSMSDQPLRVCPECSGALRKLLYPVGVHFKGSGFYTTDYKSGSGSASKNGTSGSGESGGSEGSSDKKNEGSSEKKSEGSSEKREASAAPSTE